MSVAAGEYPAGVMHYIIPPISGVWCTCRFSIRAINFRHAMCCVWHLPAARPFTFDRPEIAVMRMHAAIGSRTICASAISQMHIKNCRITQGPFWHHSIAPDRTSYALSSAIPLSMYVYLRIVRACRFFPALRWNGDALPSYLLARSNLPPEPTNGQTDGRTD